MVLLEFVAQGAVFILKAAQEGARRVLLVGARNSGVCIRDAMSGLRMRSLASANTPTVYSMFLEKNLVYCGTSIHDILVFDFHVGFFFIFFGFYKAFL